jgi:hypothetical protein
MKGKRGKGNDDKPWKRYKEIREIQGEKWTGRRGGSEVERK